MLILIVVAILALAGIAATVVVVARDGYRAQPTRSGFSSRDELPAG